MSLLFSLFGTLDGDVWTPAFLSCKLTLLGLSFFLHISPRDSGEVSHVAVESSIPAITAFDSPLRFSSSVRRDRTRFWQPSQARS